MQEYHVVSPILSATLGSFSNRCIPWGGRNSDLDKIALHIASERTLTLEKLARLKCIDRVCTGRVPILNAWNSVQQCELLRWRRPTHGFPNPLRKTKRELFLWPGAPIQLGRVSSRTLAVSRGRQNMKLS